MSSAHAPGSGRRVSRRGLLLGAAGASAVLGLGPRAHAAPAAPKGAPKVVGLAVTPDRAVLAVDTFAAPGLTTVVVTGSAGEDLGRATMTASGRAIVPIWLEPGQTRDVHVVLTNAAPPAVTPVRRTVRLSTTEKALRGSDWRVVNKRTPLTRTDVPAAIERVAGVEVDRRAAAGLRSLMAAAGRAKAPMVVSNGYRSYDWQSGLYRSYVARDGQAAADTYSARPGYSEHQTGLAVDIKAVDGRCSLAACFADTPQGKYLATRAGTAGFIVRYTEHNKDVTGYRPEPWHMRWVGTWLTSYLAETRQSSLEEAFALPVATHYGEKQ